MLRQPFLLQYLCSQRSAYIRPVVVRSGRPNLIVKLLCLCRRLPMSRSNHWKAYCPWILSQYRTPTTYSTMLWTWIGHSSYLSMETTALFERTGSWMPGDTSSAIRVTIYCSPEYFPEIYSCAWQCWSQTITIRVSGVCTTERFLSRFSKSNGVSIISFNFLTKSFWLEKSASPDLFLIQPFSPSHASVWLISPFRHLIIAVENDGELVGDAVPRSRGADF